MQFNHIGIFVKNIKFGEKELKKIIKIKKISKIFKDKNLKVVVKFLHDRNNICYEIVAPFGKNNPVTRVLKDGKNILNHLAYKTKNFDKMVSKFRNNKSAPLCLPTPAKAFGGARVIFFLTPLKIIVELIEDKSK